MKNKLLLLALCVTAPVLLHAEKKTALAKEMENIAKNVRQLSQQVNDSGRRDSSLQEIHSIQKSAETAKDLVPSKAKELPAAQQSAFVSDYKGKMDQLIGQLAKLEDAVKSGNGAEANRILSGLRSMKREGHEKFSSE